MRDRMESWSGLSAAQRNQARLNFAITNRLATDKQAQWEAYQALSDEEKRLLASRAAPKVVTAARLSSPWHPRSWRAFLQPQPRPIRCRICPRFLQPPFITRRQPYLPHPRWWKRTLCARPPSLWRPRRWIFHAPRPSRCRRWMRQLKTCTDLALMQQSEHQGR